MSRGARWLVATACVVAPAGCKRLDALASGTPEAGAPAAAAASAGIGRQVRTSLYRMTVEGVHQCPRTRYEEPEKGHIWLGVELRLEALTDTPVPANPFYARLTDSDGRRYHARFDGCKPPFSHAPLSRGATAQGLVTFEISDHATRLVLHYDPQVPGHQHQEVQFDLGR